MEIILRGTFVYFILLLLFRIAGKRTLSQITNFDLVLTLILSEAIQNALTDDDRSLTGAVLLVITLVGLNILLSLLKMRYRWLEAILEGSPTVLFEKGKKHDDRMEAERVDDAEILEAARLAQGISRMDQIDYAVVEKDGKISIVPKEGKGG
jgi:uncharacterized membrane protein YcaP (DUF421 family)